MKSLKRIGSDKSGFTTIELIVTIGIIGILAAVAIPGIASWVPDYKLKSAAQDLYSNVQQARMEAIKLNTNRSVVFYTGSGYYVTASGTTVYLSGYGPTISFSQGDATGGVGGQAFGNFVTFASPDDEASFNTRGMSNNSGTGYAYIANNKGTAYAVGSLLSGVVVLRKWTGSWE
jgi:prepilin-type N-terminal cleavage/methylation domain-containing protein